MALLSHLSCNLRRTDNHSAITERSPPFHESSLLPGKGSQCALIAQQRQEFDLAFSQLNSIRIAQQPEKPEVQSIIASRVFMLLESGREKEPVIALLYYRRSRPFEITITFRPLDGTTVTWTFARDLLMEGRYTFTGEGDVQIWTLSHSDGPRTYISLFSDSGHALLSACVDDIDSWCQEMRALVPVGSEHEQFDIDAELKPLLW
ncbi:SsgA family sporulation/cell division regulator [Streptomyces sp. NPDC050485]|uniref:SsgA family sporulation/cell division regulator n=1 Tax=Streptomyces sp. NPDC050485 TaxID=3365617 RepID=UPI0037981C50